MTDVPSPNDDGTTIREIEMKRPGFQSGYLLYTLFDARGTPKSSSGGVIQSWARPDSLLGRLVGIPAPIKGETTTYQVQVFLTGSGEPEAEVRLAARELFKAVSAAAVRAVGQ